MREESRKKDNIISEYIAWKKAQPTIPQYTTYIKSLIKMATAKWHYKKNNNNRRNNWKRERERKMRTNWKVKDISLGAQCAIYLATYSIRHQDGSMRVYTVMADGEAMHTCRIIWKQKQIARRFVCQLILAFVGCPNVSLSRTVCMLHGICNLWLSTMTILCGSAIQIKSTGNKAHAQYAQTTKIEYNLFSRCVLIMIMIREKALGDNYRNN